MGRFDLRLSIVDCGFDIILVVCGHDECALNLPASLCRNGHDIEANDLPSKLRHRPSHIPFGPFFP